MTQNTMIEVFCDAAGCECSLRESHWVGRPLSSMMGARLRRMGWVTLKADSGIFHFCPGHRDDPKPMAGAREKSSGKRTDWERGQRPY